MTRRKLISAAIASTAVAQQPGKIAGFDHVALPMQNTDAMLAFYRGLGLTVVENQSACSVYIGDRMINFHRPSLWQNASFTLKAPAAKPPCGDLCFVWTGNAGELQALLTKANAKVFEGPVPRSGGRKKTGSSVYVRDPDNNLLEFIIY
jgi:catechol 2,3-dioxygenase-like lactoylglutathione lyase family enzyme